MQLQVVSVLYLALVGVRGLPRPQTSGLSQIVSNVDAGQNFLFREPRQAGVARAQNVPLTNGLNSGVSSSASGSLFNGQGAPPPGALSTSFTTNVRPGWPSPGPITLLPGMTDFEKNIYTFVAPDMPAGPPIVIPGRNGAFKKRYNVILVKTPSMPAPEIILPQLNGGVQEKNLIYVLQELPRRPIVPDLGVAPPSPSLKPEVFLIKYDAAGNSVIAPGGPRPIDLGLLESLHPEGLPRPPIFIDDSVLAKRRDHSTDGSVRFDFIEGGGAVSANAVDIEGQNTENSDVNTSFEDELVR